LKSLYAQILCDSKTNKQRFRFHYYDKERVGEPQCCGISTTDKEAVRVHLAKGGSKPEQLCEVRQISSLKVLDEFFYNLASPIKKMIRQ
jgi:hypothetical protein